MDDLSRCSGRKNLATGASIAKFDKESVDEVRFGVALQKPDKNRKILISETVQNPGKKNSLSENGMWGIAQNTFWQSLTPNRALCVG